jgi:hypothetical protein
MLRRNLQIRRAAGAAALGTALVFGLSAPAARADDDKSLEAARALFVEASRFAEQGRWTEARVSFKASLRLRRSAMTLYSLGVVDRELGLSTEALENFRAFLGEPSSAATRRYEEPARQAIAEIEQRADERVAPAPAPAARAVKPAPSLLLPLSLIGVGAAIFAAGAITGLAGVAQAGSAPSSTGAEASSARAKGLAGDVLGGIGLGAASAGVVVLIVQKSSPAAPAVAMTPWMGVASAGVTVSF